MGRSERLRPKTCSNRARWLRGGSPHRAIGGCLSNATNRGRFLDVGTAASSREACQVIALCCWSHLLHRHGAQKRGITVGYPCMFRPSRRETDLSFWGKSPLED
jgi:hypothetical protein